MNRAGVLLMVLAVFSLGKIQLPQAALAQNSPNAVQVEADEQGLVITWTPPDYQLETVEVGGVQYSRITMPDLSSGGEPGFPQLPFFSGAVGLPPAGQAELRIVEIERETVQLPHLPIPAPVPQPVQFSALTPDAPAFFGGPTSIIPNPAGYATDELYPLPVARLEPPQQMRHWRIASLTINPVRVNPASREMEVVRFVRLQLLFDEAASAPLSGQSKPDAFGQGLSSVLLNPVALQWPGPIAGTENKSISPALALAGTTPTLKAVVTGAGLYALTFYDLQAAGLPVGTLDPRTVQMSYGPARQPVAILVEGEADGSFDPEDRVLFFANPTFSRYTDEDVYFLGAGYANPLRMQSRAGSPSGLSSGTAWRTSTAEANSIYEPSLVGWNGDYWYWDSLKARFSNNEGRYSISANSPQTNGPDAALTAWLRGRTDPGQNPDHRVKLYFNNTDIGEYQWDGQKLIELELSVPANRLQNGANQIRVSLPGLAGVVVEETFVDAFELTYPTTQGGSNQLQFSGDAGQQKYTLSGFSTANLRVFDVTEALTPSQISGYQVAASGGGYTLTVGDTGPAPVDYLVVPENKIKSPVRLESAELLSDPPGGADYIIVVHPDFSSAVAPLANHRAGQGLRVATVNVQAVYDTFGGGRISPEAIRDFLHHAYQSWVAPQPLYVVLVGDGSYDFKNYSGFNPQNYIPPWLAEVDPWLGETAADNRFVSFDDDNNFPEMLIGRLPVNSAAEAATVVDKIIQYETNPFPGGWNARHLFVGGDRLEDEDKTMSEIFRWYADASYNKLSPPLEGYRFYYDADIDSSASHIYSDYVELRDRFLNFFDAGASTVTFFGHSSWHQWNDQPVLRWSLVAGDNDVTQMENHRRYPVVLGMTCFTGFFHHPEYPTMDESLVRQPGGGAIAVWGSTGLGVATGHEELQDGFFEEIIHNGETNLGAAVLAGKANGSNKDLLDTFTLFGDPALTLDFTIVPFTEHLFVPIIKR